MNTDDRVTRLSLLIFRDQYRIDKVENNVAKIEEDIKKLYKKFDELVCNSYKEQKPEESTTESIVVDFITALKAYVNGKKIRHSSWTANFTRCQRDPVIFNKKSCPAFSFEEMLEGYWEIIDK